MTTRKWARYILMASIFKLSLLTCLGLPSNMGSLAARQERQSRPPLTRQEVANELAELAATRQIFTLTADTAPQKLNRLAKLKDGATPDLKRLLPDHQYLIGANPASGIQWIVVEFRLDHDSKGKGYWTMAQAEFALSWVAGDSDQLYKEVKAVLAARLAKLGKLETYTIDNGFAWRLGAEKVVSIQKGDFNNSFSKDKSRRVTRVVMGEESD